MALLEVKDLYKKFGDLTVLEGVSFSLEAGEVLSVIGSSGGGKTTLLRCLNSLETPDSGSVLVGGKPVFSSMEEGEKPRRDPSAQARMGLVFQQFHLFPQYTVRQNLTLAPRCHAGREARRARWHNLTLPLTNLFRREKASRLPVVSRKEIAMETDARADEILAVTGLLSKADSYPCELSGGQQQRVAIARAMMLRPDILCFDEPTSALEPELTGEVLKVIKELRQAKRTMIIVTHELGFARLVSDRILYMADGRIEEQGTPEEIFGTPRSAKLRAFIASDISRDM